MEQAALKISDQDEGESLARAAPHNVEQEQELLGAILVNNETFDRVSDFLEPGHFFIAAHQEIYSKAGQLICFTRPFLNFEMPSKTSQEKPSAR